MLETTYYSVILVKSTFKLRIERKTSTVTDEGGIPRNSCLAL